MGRKSGRSYETPIIVQPAGDGFVIELTYGPGVDWYKNVLAAGGCTVFWHGKDYVIDKIEPLDTETGRAAFPLAMRLIMRVVGLKHFVKMATHTERLIPFLDSAM